MINKISQGNKMINKMTLIKRNFAGYIFVLPAIILVILWFYIPVLWTFMLSFQKWDGFRAPEWVMFNNFVKLFNDKMALKSIYNSISMALVQTAGAVILGVSLSLMIYTATIKEGSLYRLIFFIPSMIPTAITGMLFIFMYNYDIGILNNFFRVLGLDHLTRAWLEDFSTVIGAINVVNIYKNAGLTMLLSYASLMMIPQSMIEAVKIEGGGYFALVTRIFLPLIKPIIMMSTMYILTLSFKTYSLVFTLTGGGPASFTKTVPIYMSETAFQYGEFGYSAAMGIFLTIIVVFIISLGKRFSNGESYEY